MVETTISHSRKKIASVIGVGRKCIEFFPDNDEDFMHQVFGVIQITHILHGEAAEGFEELPEQLLELI
jgi:hypothetical protein